uniref:Reverse transcriptase domain-containing protein n=1 Tax=Tanacetum cinerariifolium TaxID=118510 RepID=A0A6L2KAM8_TANCI|nr:reverse transcriptase domain-containing protein [Tanacetum cinerariifolium]
MFCYHPKESALKKGDPGSFTLPCLIGPQAVKNALTDLGASINLMPHSFFQRLGISKLKTNQILEMDEDELVMIILGWPFLTTTRAVIDVHEGKLSLRVKSEIVTFNIRKFMKSKHYHDDYLYCIDHTAKPSGGHHGISTTARKVFEAEFYWPHIFRDAHKLVQVCDACQRAGNISSRDETLQKYIQACEIFDV